MRIDVTDELSSISAWRDARPPSAERDATVAGFLWALAQVTGTDSAQLRARMGPETFTSPAAAAPGGPPAVPRAAVAAPGAPDGLMADVGDMAWPPAGGVVPAWPGLGMDRIHRTVEPGDEPARARAFTAGPDGRPTALEASYAEMARGLSDDTDGVETPVVVPPDTTT